MNLPKIQALIAPLSAPIPSALGVAAEAYNYFAKMDASGVWGWIAGAGAFIGIETLGGASCYALISLHRQRNYGIEFWIALAGIIAYVGSGLYTLADSPIIIFFFLAPFSYFAYSILRSMDVELIAKTTETETQIKLIEAQIKQLNAETRKARAGGAKPVQMNVVDSVQLSSGQMNGHCRADIAELLETDRNLSAREIARRLGISPTTASEHKKLWEFDRPSI